MMTPWFEPNQYAWIPGTAYGLAAGVMGAVVGWLVPQGRARKFVLRMWFAIWLVAAVMLVLGIVALTSGQPWGVWFALLLPGGVGTLVVGGNTLVIVKKYREVEDRRVAAKDLF